MRKAPRLRRGTSLTISIVLLASLLLSTTLVPGAHTNSVAQETASGTAPASRLQLRAVLGDAEAGEFEELSDPENPQQPLRVSRQVVLDDSAVNGASLALKSDGSPRAVLVNLNVDGAMRIRRWSEANVGRRLAIVLDGKVVSAPVVRARLGNAVEITGQDPQTMRMVVDYFAKATASGRRTGAGEAGGADPLPPGAGPATRPGLARMLRSAAPLAPGSGPTCTLDGTVYEVRLPREQIGRLDVAALTRVAAAPEAFEKALAELGPTKPLYRASQSVRLAGDSIMIGTSMPMVVSSRRTGTGQAVNTVQYTQTGAIFQIAGLAGAGRMEVDLSVELSALEEGGVEIAPNVKAPVTRKATLVHKGRVEADRPLVVVSIDAASPDADNKAVAYVARITLGPPQSPATRPSPE